MNIKSFLDNMFSKDKVGPEEINSFVDEVILLGKEIFKNKKGKNRINYCFLVYSKIESFLNNTNCLDVIDQKDATIIYNIQLIALSEIITELNSVSSYEGTLNGLVTKKYITVGFEYVDLLFEYKNLTDNEVYGLLMFLKNMKLYYEENEDYNKAFEMKKAITKINRSLNKPEDEEDDDEESEEEDEEAGEEDEDEDDEEDDDEDDDEEDEDEEDDFENTVNKKKKIKTKSGLFVQSFGEQKIADYLFDNQINFNYDKQITLKRNEPNKQGYTKGWIRPDFYLPEFSIIIEYWGLSGDYDYDAKRSEKERTYTESGTRYISIEKKDLLSLNEVLDKKLTRLGIK